MKRPDNRPKILVISNFYLPGTRSGGGTRTIVNTVERLSDRYEFHIITRGYDAGGRDEPYTGVKLGEWNEGPSRVFYLRKDSDLTKVLLAAIEELRPALLYANSFFSDLTVRALAMRRLGRTGDVPFLIAPCGELSGGALGLKSFKKRAFVRSAVISGLYDGLYWKASSGEEVKEFEALGVRDPLISVAPDLPPASIFDRFSQDLKPRKEAGAASFVFLSRFDRKKNLKWFADNVRITEGTAEMDIFGATEDERYLAEFLDSARTGASGVDFRIKGAIPYESVPETLSGYHFFVLPTLGENFGHVFLEALAAGCPLIISDRTPWGDISERGAGWAVPLEEPAEWNRVVRHCVNMSDGEYRKMSASARNYAERFLADPQVEKATVELFDKAIGLDREVSA